MNLIRLGTMWMAISLLSLGAGGCGPKKPEVSERQRKEAAHLASEAEFALTLRDWARAEGLLAKAAAAAPDTGAYWLTLGTTRMRLGNRGGAKEAYQRALEVFEADAAADKKTPEPWLRQAHVLALLGRPADGRALLEKAARQFPNDAGLRAFLQAKEYENWLAHPDFKQVTL